MKTVLKVGKTEIEIKSGEGVETYGAFDDNAFHYVFRVCLRAGNSRTSFKFTGSKNDYDNGKNVLTVEDLKDAFLCFVDDGNAGLETFEDFCDNFGYDKDSIKAHKTWQACKASNNRLLRLLNNDVSVVDAVKQYAQENIA